MAVFREDEPGAMSPPSTGAFQGGSVVDANVAASNAIRGAAQRAMQAGSETDDWVGLLGTIIGGAAAAAIPGIGPAAAIGICAASGSAAQGATKMIEGKEAGGGGQLLSGLTGATRGAVAASATPKTPKTPAAPTALPAVPDVALTPPAAETGQLPDLNPAFLRNR